MIGSVRGLAAALLAFAETRTRLAATEVEEQAVRWAEIVLWLAIAAFFLGGAMVFLGLLVVLLFWDSNRLLAAGLVGALFLGAGVAGALMAGARLRERPKFLSATIEELRRDRDRIARPPA